MDLSSIKDKINYSVIAVLTIAVIVLLCMQRCSSSSNSNLEKNIKALTDTVQVMKMKNGDLLYEKQALIVEKDELQKYLGISNKKVDDLEKKLDAKISYIAQLEGTMRLDSIVCHDTVYKLDTNRLMVHFNYADDWTTLKGHTQLTDNTTANTVISNLTERVPLTVGFDKEYKCFVTTENPNIQFTDINAAAVEKQVKSKRWGFGPTITAGIGYGYATDFKDNQVRGGMIVGFTAGVSIHYDIWQW